MLPFLHTSRQKNRVMKFSAKKIGNALAELAVKSPEEAKKIIPQVAKSMVKAGKTGKLAEVSRHFKSKHNALSNSIDVVVTASDEAAIPSLHELGGRKVSLKKIIDPSLIGGIRLETEDMIIDASIKAKIKKLRSVGN